MTGHTPPEAPLRIAMLGAFPPQAQGIHDYCGELAAALGHDTVIHALGFRAMYPAALFPGVKTPMDPTKSAPSAPHLTVTHRLAWYNPLGWLWAACTTRADVFHAQWWSLPLAPITLLFLFIMKLRGKTLIVTTHNVLPHEPSPAFVFASRLIYRLAHRVIVHSAENRAQLHTHYALPEEKTCQLPMGILAAPEKVLSTADARKQLAIDPGAQAVLFFGIIRPYKGLQDLIDAIALLHDVLPRLQLHVWGKPWEDWKPYQMRIEALGLQDSVHTRLEYIPAGEVPAIISAADIVVLPYTHFDAQSAVGAQFLPYRKPMIVTRVGGLLDWVNSDPAWIVPPRNPEALAERIRACLQDYPRACAAYAPVCDAVLDQYSWAAIAKAHLRLYREAARGVGQ